MIFDPLYFIILAPALIFSLIATAMVKMTFAKYSRVQASSGMTGAQAAALMLSRSGTTDVKIAHAQGFLGDHYDPTNKTLNLSMMSTARPVFRLSAWPVTRPGMRFSMRRGTSP